MFKQPQTRVSVSSRRQSVGATIGLTLLRLALIVIFLVRLAVWGYDSFQGRVFDKHFTQGGKYLDQKQYDLAIPEYKAAIAADDSAGPQFYNLALCYTHESHFDQAVPLLQKAIALDSKDENYHFLMARCDNHLQHLDQAVTEYLKAIRIKPDDADARYNLAMIYQKLGRQSDATAQLEEAHRLTPGDVDVNAALSRAPH